MRRSEKTSELIKALGIVQANIHNPKKNAENPFFKSKYAKLDQVLDIVLPVLNANGLFLSQTIAFRDGRTVMVTSISNDKDQWIESEMPIIASKNDMQGLGSAVSYSRRYSLTSMLGLEQEDDDGHKASHEFTKTKDESFEAFAKLPAKNHAPKGKETMQDLVNAREFAPGPPHHSVKTALDRLGEQIEKNKEMPTHNHMWQTDTKDPSMEYCSFRHNGRWCGIKRDRK